MKRLIFIAIAWLLITVPLMVYAAPPAEVPIGIPLPLTGRFQQFGEMMKNSFEMAAEQINQAGGINGRPLALVFADDKGEESSAEAAFDHMVKTNKVVMMTGGYASNPTYHMAGLADAGDVPFLICTAAADRITRKGWRNVYRMNPPISEYAKGLEDFWTREINPRSMAIIYENSMFGTGGALRMTQYCQDRAIEITVLQGYDRTRLTPTYVRSLMATVASDPPDVVYMIAYLHDAVMLVQQARRLEIPSLLCGAGGGFTLPAFIDEAGADAEGVMTVSLWSEHVPYPGARDYFRTYLQRYGITPDYHGVEAFSALLVTAEALKRASELTPAAIRQALNQTFLKTPFGPVKFYTYDDFERQNSITPLVLQIIGGRFETIWPPAMASIRYKK